MLRTFQIESGKGVSYLFAMFTVNRLALICISEGQRTFPKQLFTESEEIVAAHEELQSDKQLDTLLHITYTTLLLENSYYQRVR